MSEAAGGSHLCGALLMGRGAPEHPPRPLLALPMACNSGEKVFWVGSANSRVLCLREGIPASGCAGEPERWGHTLFSYKPLKSRLGRAAQHLPP